MLISVLVTVFSQGLGLLAVLAIGFGLIERLALTACQRSAIHGLLFGVGAILAMTVPAQFSSGLILDVRSIIVGLAAAFGGPVAALIAVILAGSYRIYLGGAGALPGALAICLAALIGIFGVRYLNRAIRATVLRFAMLGLFISLNFITIFVLGIDAALPIAMAGYPAILVTSIVAAALLGTFMEREKTAIQREREWREAAMTDALTGLPNRRQFEKIAARHLLNFSSMNSSFLVLDIDHFKSVNDAHGHLAGDRVIQEVTSILQSSTRPTDVIARLGGEEFAILLLNVDPATALKAAERIRANVEAAAVVFDGVTIPVRVSIGGLCRLVSSSYQENFKLADIAMYRAKREGRNRVVFSQETKQVSVEAA